jgi:hypothetical protein
LPVSLSRVEREFGQVELEYGLAPLRVRGLDPVARHKSDRTTASVVAFRDLARVLYSSGSPNRSAVQRRIV